LQNYINKINLIIKKYFLKIKPEFVEKFKSGRKEKKIQLKIKIR